MKEFKEKLIAWFRYLFWADIHYKRFGQLLERSGKSEEIPTNLFIAFSSQWYASLYVVVEGWEELKLEDKTISKLLNEHQYLKDLLRKYRNGVFHFQPKLLNNRITCFSKTKDNVSLWIELLHHQFVRFYSDHVSSLPGDKDHQAEMKDSIKEIVGWIPEGLINGQIRELNKILEAFDVLLKKGNESNGKAQELQNAIEQVKALIVDANANYNQDVETNIKLIKN